MTDASTQRRKTMALVLLAATQFVVVLDVSIVNVALPSIQHNLKMSTENLQWVVNAYTLVFGGFLLLGGRTADVLGRRKIYLAGLGLFAVASLGCGLSNTGAMLIALRAVQGLGAAIISPAALAILTTTFAEGKERNSALAVWGAVAGFGGAAGVLLGGILTDLLTWRWIFFINIPVAVVVILLAPRFIAESKAGAGKQFDIVGAISVTLGLAILVFGLVKSADYGWGSGRTIGALVLAVVLLGFFVFWESRQGAPLVPLTIFRNRNITGANSVMVLIACVLFGMFFFLSLYMQEILHYSPLRTGFGYLSLAIVTIIAATVAESMVNRFGARVVLTVGLVFAAAGMIWFVRLPVRGQYFSDLFPGLVVAGAGLGLCLVAASVAAISGITQEEAGIASGLINTAQQVGGALGLAILLAVASDITTNKSKSGPPTSSTVLDGFHGAFVVAAIITVVAIAVSLSVLPKGSGVTAAAPASTPPAALAAEGSE